MYSPKISRSPRGDSGERTHFRSLPFLFTVTMVDLRVLDSFFPVGLFKVSQNKNKLFKIYSILGVVQIKRFGEYRSIKIKLNAFRSFWLGVGELNCFIFVHFDFEDKNCFSDKFKKRPSFAFLKMVWRFHFGRSKFVFFNSPKNQFKFVSKLSMKSGNDSFSVWRPRRQEIWYLRGELVNWLSLFENCTETTT